LGRAATAGGDRPRPGRATGHRLGGRAHRQPRPGYRAGHPRAARGAARGRHHDRGNHPRRAHCRAHAAPCRDARRVRHVRHRRLMQAALNSPKLSLTDLARVASVGLRTRRVRAALSALGIAIGVAAIVAVLGLSSSSQAGLLSEIDKLGTNLLTVTSGKTLLGETAELPLAAPGMVSRIGPVLHVQETGATDANVY